MTPSKHDPLRLHWASASELPAVARFFGEVIGRDARYISHGEIQTGLSLDGATWIPDLTRRFEEDFQDLGPDRRAVVAYDPADAIAGAAVVLTVVEDHASYIVIEDVAVAPESRSLGVGQALVAFIEADAKASGAQWAFLESGLDNDGAHAFFERRSYRPLSKVFGKRL